MSPWLSSPKNTHDFSTFLWRIGVPLNIFNDFSISKYYMRYALGFIERPASNKDKVIEYSYKSIKKLCEQSNSLMLIIVLGHSSSEVYLPDAIKNIGVPIINAHDVLLSALLTVNDETYYNTYGHLRGDPPEVIDTHPNAEAHTIIAECILKEITEHCQVRESTSSKAISAAP